jgi:hypothetical protein
MRQTMKSAILAAVLVLAGQGAWGQVPPDSQLAAVPPAQWADPVDGIYNAQDDQQAIAAYQSAPDKTDLELNQAFVQRLVELGMPEKALDQAKIVLAASPADGLASAVIAFNDARLGNMAEAVAGITLAARSLPDDEFVVRTAAQLAAWLDQRPAGVQIHDAVVEAFDEMRQKLAGQKTFADAYTEAQTAYKELAAAQAQTAPVAGAYDQAAPAPVAPAPVDYSTPPVTVVNDTYVYDTVYQNYYLPQWYSSCMMLPAAPAYGYALPAYDIFGWGMFYGGGGWSSGYGYGYGDYWTPGLVVFVGHFHHGGVYIGHCGHHEVIVDRGRDIYVGHTRTEYVGRNRNVIIEDAHRVHRGDDGRRVADARPQRLEIAGGRVVDRTPRINDLLARPTHDRSDRLAQQDRSLGQTPRQTISNRTATLSGPVRPQPLGTDATGRTPTRTTAVNPAPTDIRNRREAVDTRTPVLATPTKPDSRITVGQPQPITRTRRDAADGTRTALTDRPRATSILPAAGPVRSDAPVAVRTPSSGGRSDIALATPAPAVTARPETPDVTIIPGPRSDTSVGRSNDTPRTRTATDRPTGIADRPSPPVTTVVNPNAPAARPQIQLPPTDVASTDRTRTRTRVEIPDWARPGAQPAPAAPSVRQPAPPATVITPYVDTPPPAVRPTAPQPMPSVRNVPIYSPPAPDRVMPSTPSAPPMRVSRPVIDAPAPASPAPRAPSRSADVDVSPRASRSDSYASPAPRAPSRSVDVDVSPRASRSDSSAGPTAGRDGPVGAAPSSDSSDRADRMDQHRGR